MGEKRANKTVIPRLSFTDRRASQVEREGQEGREGRGSEGQGDPNFNLLHSKHFRNRVPERLASNRNSSKKQHSHTLKYYNANCICTHTPLFDRIRHARSVNIIFDLRAPLFIALVALTLQYTMQGKTVHNKSRQKEWISCALQIPPYFIFLSTHNNNRDKTFKYIRCNAQVFTHQ